MSTAAIAAPSSAVKRKDPPGQPPSVAAAAAASTQAPATAAASVVTPTAPRLSPYQSRTKALRDILARLGGNDKSHVLCDFGGAHILERIPGKLDQLGYDEAEEMTSDELTQQCYALTEADLDAHWRIVLVPKPCLDLLDKYHNAILRADDRNDGDDGFIMLNTYSSLCMYPVIHKQLNAASREVNKALKAPLGPGVAQQALNHAVAAVVACNDCDHWRLDTEDSDECDKITRKVSKILKDLLKFTDEELGLVDPFTRRALLGKFRDMQKDWASIEWLEAKITFATAQNGQGLGVSRSAVAASSTTAPAAKKPRTQAPLAPTTSGSGGAVVLAYLSGIQDKLSLRVKTNLQLQISTTTTSGAAPPKTCRVVVSGATSLKKMGQLCAYLTGQSADFHYHSQKGKSMKGAYFEIRLHGDVLWIGEKALAKPAQAQGVGHVEDKTVKIVQVFQGLICDANRGLTYDSSDARTVATTAGSVVWHAGQGQSYEVSVQGILSNKSCSNSSEPLPRVVDDDNRNSHKRTGFGMTIRGTNAFLKADRKGSAARTFLFCTKAETIQIAKEMMAEPMCTADGRVVDDGRMQDRYFEVEMVDSAGRP